MAVFIQTEHMVFATGYVYDIIDPIHHLWGLGELSLWNFNEPTKRIADAAPGIDLAGRGEDHYDVAREANLHNIAVVLDSVEVKHLGFLRWEDPGVDVDMSQYIALPTLGGAGRCIVQIGFAHFTLALDVGCGLEFWAAGVAHAHALPFFCHLNYILNARAPLSTAPATRAARAPPTLPKCSRSLCSAPSPGSSRACVAPLHPRPPAPPSAPPQPSTLSPTDPITPNPISLSISLSSPVPKDLDSARHANESQIPPLFFVSHPGPYWSPTSTSAARPDSEALSLSTSSQSTL